MRLLTRWVPLLLGLTLGLAVGLTYTWVIEPVEVANTRPPLLRSDYRWDWVRMTALSYIAERDMGRVQARLAGIARRDVAGAIQALIEEYAAAGRPATTLRTLSTLAQALGIYTPAMRAYLQTQVPMAVPTHTPTPRPPKKGSPTHTPVIPTPPPPTATPTPTPTPTPPALPPFRLERLEQICEPGTPPHIQVIVQDEDGNGLAGVEVWLMWPGGADRAVTGLKPQKGKGYADFDVEPGISYDLSTGVLGAPLVGGLVLVPCPAQGEQPVLGSWRIVLTRRPAEGKPSEETRQP